MPYRTRSALVAALTAVLAWTAISIAPVAAATQKVVIIVGPTGAQTDNYRSTGDDIATTAEAAGANVVKVYSPNATWANVRDAVDGANIIVYLGHGNGYPSPYSTTENRDRVNGWGLNRTPNNGDDDNWSTTMVYCGEKALLGTLDSGDGAAQRQYCSGGPITPAAGFVMIYNKACYTPGAGEGWDTKATQTVARERVRNYSYPVLALGAKAYFATDLHNGAERLADLILLHPDWTFGQIARNANGYDAEAQRHFNHPDLATRQIWIQKTGNGDNADFWYAYAGRPWAKPSGGGVAPPAPKVSSVAPGAGSQGVGTGALVRAWFDVPVVGVSATSFRLADAEGFAVQATVAYNASLRRAQLTPNAPLSPGTRYTATLTGAIRTPAGGQLASKAWNFRTAGSPDPDRTVFNPDAQLTFRTGTHTGYQFDAHGNPTAVRNGSLGADSGAKASLRRPVPNQTGKWFYVVNGMWAGYWMRESAGIFVAGAPHPDTHPVQRTFDPTVQLLFRQGTHTGYRFNASGAMTAARTVHLAWDSTARTSEQRIIANQYGSFWYVTNGAWAGYWVRVSQLVHLAD